jgi:hypothetical protein
MKGRKEPSLILKFMVSGGSGNGFGRVERNTLRSASSSLEATISESLGAWFGVRERKSPSNEMEAGLIWLKVPSGEIRKLKVLGALSIA